MLEQLLSELKAQGLLDAAALARRLDTTPAMVQAMLEHLQRIGVLEALPLTAPACQGCSLAESCSTGCQVASGRVWQLARQG